MTIDVNFLEQGGQPPAQVAALLVEFLSAARTSLHLAIYDFHLSPVLGEPVIKALLQQAAKGVEIRIVFDAGKPGFAQPEAGADPASGKTAEFLHQLTGHVQAKAISGGHNHMPRLMHHKYVIRDGRTPAAAVWSGSTNFTDDSWRLQENNILHIASPELCAYYETDFSELWARGDISTTGANDTGTVHVADSIVEVAFAPGEGMAIDHEVAHRVGAARSRIKICSMLITSGCILGALNDVLHIGRLAQYGGIFDRTQMESVFDQWQGTPAEWKIGAFKQVSAGLSGKRSTPYGPGTPHDFMHNKVLVIDDTVITGSFNLSHSATENAENILVIQDAVVADRYNAYIDHLIARYSNS
jgi:phosphatidylserine/phosphatidylglycerophosphate/cardiolipin synthase-like enzyme